MSLFIPEAETAEEQQMSPATGRAEEGRKAGEALIGSEIESGEGQARERLAATPA